MPLPRDQRDMLAAFLKRLPLSDQQRERAVVIAERGGRPELALGVLPPDAHDRAIDRFADFRAGWEANERARKADGAARAAIGDTLRQQGEDAQIGRQAAAAGLTLTRPDGTVIGAPSKADMVKLCAAYPHCNHARYTTGCYPPKTHPADVAATIPGRVIRTGGDGSL